MSSLPLISHHLFVAATKSKRRVGRRPARVAPDAGDPTERAVELHLLNNSRSANTEAAWPLEFASRNGPA